MKRTVTLSKNTVFFEFQHCWIVQAFNEDTVVLRRVNVEVSLIVRLN